MKSVRLLKGPALSNEHDITLGIREPNLYCAHNSCHLNKAFNLRELQPTHLQNENINFCPSKDLLRRLMKSSRRLSFSSV